jgi:hypothetical protein
MLAAAVTVAVILPATPALANSSPNPYTPVGASWVDVDVIDRVYFEPFDDNWDDWGVFFVPTGIECTRSAVTATGPFLATDAIDDGNCIDGSMNPIDPIDPTTRTGAVPLGFSINFFGTTYSDVYLNTNGGISFDEPDTNYNQSLASLASDSESSAMYPLGADLFYAVTESNLWMGNTIVDSKPAVVFSWENFHNCCTSAPSTEDMSFQLVIINLGGGDFDAWFNFESIEGFQQGYSAPLALIDLNAGVTPGSNIYNARNVKNVPTDCTEANADILGTATDSDFDDAVTDTAYFRLVNAAARTVSIWSDAACTVPLSPTMRQDEAADLAAYLEIAADDGFRAIGSGWSTYNPTTGAIDATELLYNIDSDELINSASNPLIERSLNSAVAGRFVVGQRGGNTVGDPDPPAGPVAAPVLAATGTDFAVPALLVALATLVLGALALTATRQRRRA